jgi:L-threonylcarbamoyladenylate synthase
MERIALEELLGRPAAIARLAETLKHGGLAAMPTETFYALAADPRSETGVRRALAVKRRDEAKALLVLFGSRPQLADLGVAASPQVLDRLFSIWPAPLTAVLRLETPMAASRGAMTLGVRMPAHALLRALLRGLGPVTGTSLNRSGESPCADAESAARLFAGELDVLVDGGRTPGGLASTLIDATREPPAVLRQGAYAWSAEGL